jgi:hypothetical protein
MKQKFVIGQSQQTESQKNSHVQVGSLQPEYILV